MDIYPDDLNVVLEKKFAFKIDVTNYNLERNVPVYGISKLTDDYKIISELEKKFYTEQVTFLRIFLQLPINYYILFNCLTSYFLLTIQPPESDSLNVTMSDFPRVETVTLKVLYAFH